MSYKIYAGPAAVCADQILDKVELLTLSSLGRLQDVANSWFGAWFPDETHRTFLVDSSSTQGSASVINAEEEIQWFEAFYAADLAALSRAYRIVEVSFVVVIGID
jgi:hypothetical protein